MKRAVLLGRLARMAAEGGVRFEMLRHGGRHDLFVFGGAKVVVPRHREVNEHIALAIIRDCERQRRSER